MPFISVKSIITRPKYQLSKKKTPSLTSSQCKRHSNDKLSSSNFSSGFKPKVPRHSQDIDCDVLFTSCDQTNAREIGNFKQAHRKQRKIEEIVGATKSDGYKRRIMKRQQPHAAVEAEKKKLQTKEDKFGNDHTYQDHMPSKIWYKDLWRELKKQAKKVANSNADADSSSDESIHVGDFKQGHRKQGKIQAIVVATKSGGYERQIMNRQQSHATVETEKTKIQTKEDKLGNHHTYQDHMVNEKIWYKYLWRKWKKKAKQIANSNADADSSSYKSISDSDEKQTIFHKSQIKSIKTRATKRPSDSTRIKLEKIIAFDKKSTFPSSEGVKIESWGNVSYRKIVPATDVSSHLSSPKQGSVADLKLLGDIITTSEKTGEKPVEVGLTTLQHKGVEELLEVGLTTLQHKGVEELLEVGLTTLQHKAVEKLLEIYKDYDMQNINADLAETQTKFKGKTYLVGLKPLQYKAVEKLLELTNAVAVKRAFDSHGTRRPSDSTGNNFEKLSVKFKGVEVNHVSQKRDNNNKMEPSVQASMILESNIVYINPPIPADSPYPSIPNQNINNQERRITHGNENRDVAENHEGNGEHLVTSQNLDAPTTQDQMQDEGREATILMLQQILSMLSDYRNRNNEERCITQGNEKENGDVAENHEGNGEHLVTSQNLDTPITQDQIQDEGREATRWTLKQILSMLSDDCRHKSTEASEGGANQLIHHTDICSDDHRTTLDSQEDNSTGMPGSMVNENWCKIQAEQISSSEANTDISSNESLSTVESTAIRLYRDVIRNETSRMMLSIDRVVSEAVHLFGFERSLNFFDLLLDEELCRFESAGAISQFVPNMVESTVRQNVISFFEHAQDMMNILMTLLLRCPDRNILQQMPVQNFTSLIKSVIKSSLKAETKEGEKLSLERKIYNMVDPKDFERALGENTPEDVLKRLRRGDEMVVHRFVDTELKRHQPSDRKDNRPIHSIYFPSDCRLFIYIPTEEGSYWHHSDMRRAVRIRRPAITSPSSAVSNITERIAVGDVSNSLISSFILTQTILFIVNCDTYMLINMN